MTSADRGYPARVGALTDQMDQTYRYAVPSQIGRAGGQASVQLSTSGGTQVPLRPARPGSPVFLDGVFFDGVFFDGQIEQPAQAAAGLLAVALVARTRFYRPPGMVAAIIRAADPVVTSDGERLRFESFSPCCGVYARLDLLPGSLAAPPMSTGTTNVDVNPPLRQALSSLHPDEPMRLTIGNDVTVTTTANAVTEERVPLSSRWVRGFGEVQALAAGMRPRVEISPPAARRFLASLPRSTSSRPSAMYAVPVRDGLRWSSTRGPDAVPLTGPERLRVLEPLLRHATALRGYASDDTTGASVWELDLDGARFVVALSPGLSRGFSGEGRLLYDLADDQAADDARLVSAILAHQPQLDLDRLGAQAGIAPSSRSRIETALTHLAAAGRVGFDCAEGAYFHRELPFDRPVMEQLHPRLTSARTLREQGALATDPADPSVTYVGLGDHRQVVRVTADGVSCTCPWYAQHRSDRGPCKHILAVTRVGCDGTQPSQPGCANPARCAP